MKKILCCILAIAALATCSINVNAVKTCSGKFYDLIDEACDDGHFLCNVSLTQYYTAKNGVIIDDYHDEYEYHHGIIELYYVCEFKGVSIASV